jgi:hypothetical protein
MKKIYYSEEQGDVRFSDLCFEAVTGLGAGYEIVEKPAV